VSEVELGRLFFSMDLEALSFCPIKKAPAATAAHKQLIRTIFLIDLKS
jgi:hypothetical protein